MGRSVSPWVPGSVLRSEAVMLAARAARSAAVALPPSAAQHAAASASSSGPAGARVRVDSFVAALQAGAYTRPLVSST
jgi:hypothetical protein